MNQLTEPSVHLRLEQNLIINKFCLIIEQKAIDTPPNRSRLILVLSNKKQCLFSAWKTLVFAHLAATFYVGDKQELELLGFSLPLSLEKNFGS